MWLAMLAPRVQDVERKREMTDDIVVRLRRWAEIHRRHDSDGSAAETDLSDTLNEAATEIEFLRKQSRGHFEAMNAVLLDGIKALDPSNTPGKPN